MHLRIPSREVAERVATALRSWASPKDAVLHRLADALDACPDDLTPMTPRELSEQVEDLRARRAYLEGVR